MFLRNYDNFLMVLMGIGVSANEIKKLGSDASLPALYNNLLAYYSATGSNNMGSPTFVDGGIGYKTISGNIIKVSFSHYTSLQGCMGIISPTGLGKSSICLGTGNTAVTYDDYKLSGEYVANNLVFVSENTTYDTQSHSFKKSATYTYTNSGAEDITIKEWGLFSLGNNYTDTNSCLFFREVLSSPITIAAGTTGTLTFSIEIPMPNHP